MFSEFPGFEVTIDQFSLYDLVIGPNRVRVGWTSITSGILGFPNEISRQLFSLCTPDPSSDVIAPRFGPIAKSYRLNWSIVTSNPSFEVFPGNRQIGGPGGVQGVFRGCLWGVSWVFRGSLGII